MGNAAGWRRTEGPKAGEWFLDAYYYSFDPTGHDLVDELLSALAWAGKRYHYTGDWNNPAGDDEPSSIEEIQAAAHRIAARLRELEATGEAKWRRNK